MFTRPKQYYLKMISCKVGIEKKLKKTSRFYVYTYLKISIFLST